jgi:5-formyltetrahydrofolate cyclo-ligase
MDPSSADQKLSLRQEITAELADMTNEARDSESAAIVSHLKRFARDSYAVVLATLPFATEPNLVPFLQWWLEAGQKVALARTGPGRSLTFHYVDSLAGPWDVRPFGMREPPATAPWAPGPPTLALVPGLGFAAGLSQGGLLRPVACPPWRPDNRFGSRFRGSVGENGAD